MTKDELNNDRLKKEAAHAQMQMHTRRHFLKESAFGLGALAFGSLLGSCGRGKAASSNLFDPVNPLAAKAPMFPGTARSVIYIHMAGAPSQLELFSYKPELAKLDGLDCPPSLLEGKKFAFIRGVPKMLGPQAKFRQHGQSGLWLSDNLPHLSNVIDDIAFINTVATDQFNHAPAQLLMNTGSARGGRPSIGSWITYGLGTENKNLPGFVVLTSGGNNPDGGKSLWGSGFLPSVYQGVQCRSEGDPVLFISDPEGMSRDVRKASIEAINKVNQEEYKAYNDPEILSRIAQYEMAYKMQISVPDVMDIKDEPHYIHDMYGTKPGEACFANNVLLARKLVEKGVRFVQLFDWGWDAHGDSAGNAVDIGLVNKCRQVDKPVTALLLDLKQRGLLDETLVVWGSEFGRTPMQENRDGKTMAFKGRDHHGDAFTVWMAGGGIKGGTSYGETDEIGYSIVDGKTEAFDIQATILNQLGFNHEQFTYEFQEGLSGLPM
ncbi:DUF1501 domain-containing protein [Niabella hibiscisoli]|uniref:DUF1501 domain-containing protein n=1 Tax=Niabella hibiscisoli TaxID=1825928 RepID=UPI001F0E7179|nr:DUF1501 domain-containing protein [Niabella hibiscisoli]MCH5721046.1 DUF1501 domain-containing protein [Niabella hibiscisoli]